MEEKKVRMLTVPVTENFYNQFRQCAAGHNMGIAPWARGLLEKAVTRHIEKNSIAVEKLERE